MNPEWRTRYDAAQEVARQAGRLALRYFDTTVAVEWKHDQTPVTVADRETETALRSALRKAFPNDGFLGEEHGDQPGSSGYRWIIDPIDGTRNFFRGIPIWGTLVGLEHRGELIAGVVDMPALGLTYRALRGDGAYRGERRIRVSDISTLERATVFYTTLSAFTQADHKPLFLDLMLRTQVPRGYGDCYGYMLVAQGSGELMFEHGVHPWDVAAVRPIVEEAGGRFTNWDGGTSIFRPDIVASNGRVHEEVLRLLPRTTS